MPARYHVRFTRPREIKRREWNEIVRVCLRAAANFWLRMFALKHFEPGGIQRYGMAARSPDYVRRRNARAQARGEAGGANLVWTGKAREIARMRAAYPELLANLDARATSNKQYVRVPIPIGHPINPRIATDGGSNDFGKLVNEEVAAMNRVARDELEAQMLTRFRQKETVELGAAA